MAIARRAVQSESIVASDPFTTTLPTGWQGGDVAVLAVFLNATATLTTPSGWTALFVGSVSGASDTFGWLFWRTLQAGDAAPSLDFSGIVDGAAVTVTYSGVDQAAPIEASTNSGNVAGTAHEAGTVTTIAAGREVVTFASMDAPAPQTNNWTAFSGYSKWDEIDASGDQITAVADNLEPAPGAYSPDWTSVVNDNSLVFTVALKPAENVLQTFNAIPFIGGVL